MDSVTDVNGAVGMQPQHVSKKPIKEWVKFSDPVDEKPPINDFVEAKIGDPYNIDVGFDEPPPDYTSQVGTPATDRRVVNPNILTEFSNPADLPDIKINDGKFETDA